MTIVGRGPHLAPDGTGANARPTPRHNREAEILAAAIEVFARRGYAAAAMQAVADRAGVRKGSLYHYIDSKEDLLFRICEGVHRDVLRVMEDATAADKPPLERLHRFSGGLVGLCLDNARRVRLYLRDWRQLEGDRRAQILGHRETYRRFVTDLLREAQDRGEVRADTDIPALTLFLFSAFEGVSDLLEGREDDANALARNYADLAVATALGTTLRDLASTT
ncbi:MAG: TetR family transcriptional regulator [Thermoleophilaceae bacterium]